jgi:RNA polymerase sigma factor (sigma-70 family)
MDDRQILALIQAGRDDKALAKLYQHLPAIRRMIRYYGGTKQQAEDIFQESLIIFCRKAKADPAFSLSSGIYPYLYSVCRFLWSDELKKSRRSNTISLDEAAQDNTGKVVEDSLEEEARYRLAEQIISGLADRCRELLLMFYQGRIKLRDIATKMGYSSEQTAKNQKYKCLEAARARYQQQANLQSL